MSTKTPPTFRNNVDELIGLVGDVGQSFTKPDDDWIPVTYIIKPDGGAVVMALATDKQYWPIVIKQAVQQTKAIFAGAVLSSWTVSGELSPHDLAFIRKHGVSQHPDRREVLIVECSDGRRNETWMADIVRSEDSPPKLQNWNLQKVDEKEGMLANLIAGAFKTEGSIQ